MKKAVAVSLLERTAVIVFIVDIKSPCSSTSYHFVLEMIKYIETMRKVVKTNMKVALFAPYFGPQGATLPNYFEYWQKSAAMNSKIDFFIPTNLTIDQYKKYDNIHFIELTADEFWDKLQKILDFPISHAYYKTAEYRVFFGIIFSDILKSYDYWGSTEFDVIYGNIYKFIEPYIDEGAEVIGATAPFRLIKNTDRLCYMPFVELRDFEHPLTLEKAFSRDYCWFFDEFSGMNIRYYQEGVNVISIHEFFGDVVPKYKYFSCLGKQGVWGFNWNAGTLTAYSNRNENKEIMLAHFQKRRLEIDNIFPADIFCIVPGRIINDVEYCLDIESSTVLYTISERYKKYKKIVVDHKKYLQSDDKLIQFEINQYLESNGLIKKQSSENAVIRLLHKIKQSILWT